MIVSRTQTLVTGMHRSGKSTFAETQLDDYNYFATLEPTDTHRQKIEEHRKRRGENCKVYEAVASVPDDLEGLQGLVDDSKGLIFDGLTVYLLRVYKSVLWDLELWLHLSEQFINGLCTTLKCSNISWAVVDICSHGLDRFGSDVRSVNEYTHQRIASLPGTQHVALCSQCRCKEPL